MNQILGRANIKDDKIIYTYVHDGQQLNIETPKTKLNQNVKEGEMVDILMGVSPHEEPKPVVEPIVNRRVNSDGK